MLSHSITPVLVPDEGFASLPAACERMHQELGQPILTFACGASADVRSRLSALEASGQIQLLDSHISTLLTRAEMRNLAAEAATGNFILCADPSVHLLRSDVERMVAGLKERDGHFVSPMLTRGDRVAFGGVQLRSTHKPNGELSRIKLFDVEQNALVSGIASELVASDSVDFRCFIGRVSIVRELIHGWDGRMAGLEMFDFALRARFHKLRVFVDRRVRVNMHQRQTFDTHDRAFRAFCGADPFRQLAEDAFLFKWSAVAPEPMSVHRHRRRDIFLRRSLQTRIDDAIARLARYQSPEPKSLWRDLMLG